MTSINPSSRIPDEPRKAKLVETATTVKGHQIGRKTTRVSFGDQTPTVSMASRIKIFLGDLFAKRRGYNPFYANIKVDQAVVKIDLHSLAKQLKLPENEVLEHALSNTLDDYLETAIDVQDQFKKMMAGDRGQLPTSALQVNENTLKLIIDASVRDIQKGAAKTQVVKVKNHKYTYYKDVTDKLVIVRIKNFAQEKPLGAGSFGAAYRMETSIGTRVFKRAEGDYDYRAKDDIEHEYALLTKINPSRADIEGLMPTPHACFRLQLKAGGIMEENVGYLTPEFTCDVSKVNVANVNQSEAGKPTVSRRELLAGFQQLANGLNYIHRNKVTHGDIKPSNMSYDEISKKWRHIDLGGAIDHSDLTSEKLEEMYLEGKSIGVHTDDYLPRMLISPIRDAASDGDVAQYLELQKRRDIFALGISFLGKAATTLDFSSTREEVIKALKQNGFSEEFAAAVYNMVVACGYDLSIPIPDYQTIFQDEIVTMNKKLEEKLNERIKTDRKVVLSDSKIQLGKCVLTATTNWNYPYNLTWKTGSTPFTTFSLKFTMTEDGSLKTRDGQEFTDLTALENAYRDVIKSKSNKRTWAEGGIEGAKKQIREMATTSGTKNFILCDSSNPSAPFAVVIETAKNQYKQVLFNITSDGKCVVQNNLWAIYNSPIELAMSHADSMQEQHIARNKIEDVLSGQPSLQDAAALTDELRKPIYNLGVNFLLRTPNPNEYTILTKQGKSLETPEIHTDKFQINKEGKLVWNKQTYNTLTSLRNAMQTKSMHDAYVKTKSAVDKRIQNLITKDGVNLMVSSRLPTDSYILSRNDHGHSDEIPFTIQTDGTLHATINGLKKPYRDFNSFIDDQYPQAILAGTGLTTHIDRSSFLDAMQEFRLTKKYEGTYFISPGTFANEFVLTISTPGTANTEPYCTNVTFRPTSDGKLVDVTTGKIYDGLVDLHTKLTTPQMI